MGSLATFQPLDLPRAPLYASAKPCLNHVSGPAMVGLRRPHGAEVVRKADHATTREQLEGTPTGPYIREKWKTSS